MSIPHYDEQPPEVVHSPIEGKCWACWTGYPTLRDEQGWRCAEEPYPEHPQVQVALAVALADASRVGAEPFESEEQRAALAVSFLECDTQGIVFDLGPHAQWSVVFAEDRESATINGVPHAMRYDVDGNSTLEPSVEDQECPSCHERPGFSRMGEDYEAGTVDLECKGCFEVVTVPIWWPRSTALSTGQNDPSDD